jgi:hypothetical protein
VAISVGGAVGAGFGLIGRRPWAVLGWGVFAYLAFFLLSIVAIVVFGLSMFAAVPTLMTPGATPSPQDVVRLMGAIWPMFLIFTIGQLVIGAILQGAVYRSVLRPDDRAFFSIRIGVEEVVLFLLYLVFVVFMIVAYIAFVVAVIAAGFAGHAIGGIGGGLVTFLLVLASFMALLWVATRFALAGPMSFAERRVRFFGAWALSRGEGWRLFGLAWLIGLILFGLAILFYIVLLIVVLIVGVAGFASAAASAGGAQGLAQNPAALMAMWPMLALMFVIYLVFASAFIGGTQAIFLAPWAEAYRQLRGSPDVAATFS